MIVEGPLRYLAGAFGLTLFLLIVIGVAVMLDINDEEARSRSRLGRLWYRLIHVPTGLLSLLRGRIVRHGSGSRE